MRQMSSDRVNKGEPPEMSEAHLLAPWYIAGKLDEDEARQIEELAKEDPEFALLLKEASREAEASVSLNEALENLPRSVWERLERTIEDESRARSQAPSSGFMRSAKTSDSRFTAGF